MKACQASLIISLIAAVMFGFFVGQPMFLSKAREAGATNMEESKAKMVAEVLSTLTAISNLARSHSRQSDDSGEIDRNTRLQIRKKVDNLSSPEKLAMLGHLLRGIIAAGKAEDSPYDNVIDVAYWYCVKRLADQTSEEAVWYLNRLREVSNVDAGDALSFDEEIARQAAKRKSLRHN